MKKGTTEKCWIDFVLRATDKSFFPHLAKLADVGVDAVSRWTKRTRSPLGKQLLAVRHFLAIVGYEVSELEGLDSDLYDLSLLIVFGTLSLEEIAEQIGFDDYKKVLVLYQGKSRLGTKRARLFRALFEKNKAEVFANKHAFAEKVQTCLSKDFPGTTSLGENGASVESIVKAVVAAHKAIELLVSEDSSRSTRELFRKQAFQALGGNGLPDFWERVNALLSESAFNTTQNKGKAIHVK